MTSKMSSIVALVLAESEKVEMEDLERDSYMLLNDALTLKHDYIEALGSHYVKLEKSLNSIPYFNDFESLCNSFHPISETLVKAKPTPTFSEVQLENLTATVEEVKGYVTLLKQLTEIDRALCNAKSYYGSNNFLESAKSLHSCRKWLKETCQSDVAEIIKAMQRDWQDVCRDVMYALTNLWHEYISFKNVPRSSVRSLKVVRMSVNLNDKEQFLTVVEAMKYVDLCNFKFKSLGTTLLEHIFKPLVEHECIVRKEENLGKGVANLEVTIEKKSSSPTYAIVLHNSKLVFEFINDHMNHKISDDTNFLTMIGRFIDRDFCKLAFKMSFFDSKDIGIFTSDVHSTEEFKRYLCEIGFINFDVYSQGKYIPEMFEYLQMCRILEDARSLMHKKLFETVIVKNIFSPKHQYYLDLFNKRGPVTKELLDRWEKIPNQLSISKSTHDLIVSIYRLLELATKVNKFEGVKLFYTAKNIFDMYDILLPGECEELARNSAHLSGIIFNNCSHFCDWIINLGPKYRSHFPELDELTVATFTPEAIRIRQTGEKIFQNFVESQITKLVDQINEPEFTLESISALEEAMLKCLNTIDILKSTWFNLLAYHVYIRTIGGIMNAVLKEWAKRILLLKNIQPDFAACLRVLLQDTVKRLKTNFDEDELSRVKYLEKLNAYHVVLEGNAHEIVHKWKKGKGELAERLIAAELEKLARSLFQSEELVYILNSLH